MDAAALCSVAALLTVVPNQSQFFQHESVTLKCQPLGNLLDWKVMRNTSKHTNKECLSSGNSTDKSSCFLDYLIPSDSGVYWCESGPGFYSNTINISVTGGHVIVEVPVFPVVEGANVTLFCKGRDSPSLYSSNSLTGTFYKDGALVESSSAGILTIHNVSKSDEGHYSCASGKDTSPESWLTVTVTTGGSTVAAGKCGLDHCMELCLLSGQCVGVCDEKRNLQRPQTCLLCILLPVVVVLPTSTLLMLFCFHRRRKVKKADVLYTDIIITPVVQRKQPSSDVDGVFTVYSTLKPELQNMRQGLQPRA
ncbi:uncharacterized protein LOC103389696 [Cynoglossus semilaevis]|uniref:uncharacterized protein LOC103389696 n=1 Tax=Cynoglossus semilaevis TaxID=244447 RepID=UPI00049701B4|nr:Fc receptor-like B [Cynoglossus semilaevis]XP_016888375.1 Fc receptor-like B [Cynoglossus semilaevis]